jgi:hypothetical protein
MTSIQSYLSDILTYYTQTKGAYSLLIPSGIDIYPIPFFGDIRTANVITVGVNPSAGEFATHRNWPPQITPEYIRNRLIHYFDSTYAPPHPWFTGWSSALSVLNLSYITGNAAHIDLSFRPTKSISELNRDGYMSLFNDMLVNDIQYFFKILPLCENLKLLLLAGAATNSNYLNEFIKNTCIRYGYQLRGEYHRGGTGSIAFQELIGEGKQIPTFFCSSSPSAKDHGKLLLKRISEDKSRIIELSKENNYA